MATTVQNDGIWNHNFIVEAMKQFSGVSKIRIGPVSATTITVGAGRRALDEPRDRLLGLLVRAKNASSQSEWMRLGTCWSSFTPGAAIGHD